MRLLRLNYYLANLRGSDCFFVLGLCSIMLWSPKLSPTNVSIMNLLLYLTSKLWALCCVMASTVLACVEGSDGWAVQEFSPLGYTHNFLLVTNLQRNHLLPSITLILLQPDHLKMYFHGKKVHARVFVKCETERPFNWTLMPELSTATQLRRLQSVPNPFPTLPAMSYFWPFPWEMGPLVKRR